MGQFLTACISYKRMVVMNYLLIDTEGQFALAGMHYRYEFEDEAIDAAQILSNESGVTHFILPVDEDGNRFGDDIEVLPNL